MKKILLPTDFSDNSWNAIKYALQLFKNQECKFYLLNTYTPVIYHVEYVLVSPAQFGLGDAIRENAMNGLENMEKRIKQEYDNQKHTFESIASFNNLISEIKDLSESKKIDYIVMGTKGSTGAKEVLFGSNTVHVFKSVKCPVLAIPDNFYFESPLEILFPSDYGVTFQDKHVQPILDIADEYHARINILNVTNNGELTSYQEQNKQLLDTYFERSAHLFHNVKNMNVPEAITAFQLKSRINLLVMINNKHSFFENLFFGSSLNQIGFHLHVPLLVIQ